VYQVVCQETGSIEIGLDGVLTADEFKEVIHQLESLSVTFAEINVLFDTTHLEKYDFRIAIEEFKFYREYRHHLRRVALVSDKRFAEFFMGVFGRFTSMDVKVYPTEQIEEARKWIFPSRLP
jgi:hypothetical protein